MSAVPRSELTDEMSIQRSKMTERLQTHYGISDPRVIEAMASIPRHKFVPEALKSQAYNDSALPISSGQTISQPFIVAKMTELLGLTGGEKVLEIGSGTGYQTAVLASIARRVYAIERLPNLTAEAAARLDALGIRNVTFKTGDGTEGWKIYSPFDAILVAAGGPHAPKPLISQLAIGGRLVVPVGKDRRSQMLVRITKTENGISSEDCGTCSFVPLIGEHGWEG